MKQFFKGLGVIFGMTIAVLFSQSLAASLSQSGVEVTPGQVTPDAVLWGMTVLGFIMVGVVGWALLVIYEHRKWTLEGVSKGLTIVWAPLVLYVLVIVLQFVFPVESGNNQKTIVDLFGNYPIVTVLLTCCVAPVLEELVFRGLIANYWFSQIKGNGRFVLYCIVSACCFSLIHFPSTLSQFLIYAGMGYSFAWLYLAKKDIRYSMALHFLNNALSMLLMFLTIK